MNKILILLIAFLLIAVSCGDIKQGDNAKSQIQDTSQEPKEELLNMADFSFKLENKEKLFSKFWLGMSKLEYQKVVEILAIEGTMVNNDNPTYSAGYLFSCSSTPLDIHTSFRNDKLINIYFYSGNYDNDCLYDLYKRKYDLNPIVKIDRQCTCYKKPNTFNKNLYFPNPEEKISLPSRTYKIKTIKGENPIVIERVNHVIVIDKEYSVTEDDYTFDDYFEGKDYTFQGYIDKSIELSAKAEYLNICEIPQMYFHVKYESKEIYNKRISDKENQRNEQLEKKEKLREKNLDDI